MAESNEEDSAPELAVMPMLELQLDSAVQQARIQATLALLPEALWARRALALPGRPTRSRVQQEPDVLVFIEANLNEMVPSSNRPR